MKRREFTAAVGATALGWPVATLGQRRSDPVIGLLNSRTAEDTQHLIAGFKKGLAENDYVDGQNITIEYRWARGRYDRLPVLAAELVSRNVTVLVATGGEPVALAAQAATSTIPIVFTVSGDPAQLGLAQSFARPGGNATGVSNFQSDIGAKRLGLLPVGTAGSNRRLSFESRASDGRNSADRCPRRRNFARPEAGRLSRDHPAGDRSRVCPNSGEPASGFDRRRSPAAPDGGHSPFGMERQPSPAHYGTGSDDSAGAEVWDGGKAPGAEPANGSVYAGRGDGDVPVHFPTPVHIIQPAW